MDVGNTGYCLLGSDHEMVVLTRQHVKFKDKKTSFIGRSYKNYNKDNFVNSLRNMNWELIALNNDPALMWDYLINRIKSQIDLACPLKRFKVKVTNKPWITLEIIEQIKDKDRALKRAKRTKNDDDWSRARRLRNECLRVVRRAKSDFIKNEIDAHPNDPKKFWDNIASVLPSTSPSSNYIKLKNQNTNEPIKEESTSEFINDYFSGIGKSLASKLSDPWSYNGLIGDNLLVDCQTNIDEVISLIKEIDTSKSSSLHQIINYVKDKIGVVFLRSCVIFDTL